MLLQINNEQYLLKNCTTKQVESNVINFFTKTICFTFNCKVNGCFISEMGHPCLTNNGGCNQMCIPAESGTRTCLCSIGYKKDADITCSPYSTFAIVSQLDISRGFSLKDSSEAMTPIAGPGKLLFLSLDWTCPDNKPCLLDREILMYLLIRSNRIIPMESHKV